MAIEDIIVEYDFLTEEELSLLYNYVLELDADSRWVETPEDGDPYRQWTNRILGAGVLLDKESGFGNPKDILVFNTMLNITNRIKDKINEVYAPSKPMYHDGVNIVKWPHGYVQPAHSDHENYGLEPHVFNWRQIGNVVYLNDNFEGGEIHFPQHGVTIPIKPGMMAFFPGDVHHSHGVNRVLNGNRFTLTLFWTDYEEHQDPQMKAMVENNNA